MSRIFITGGTGYIGSCLLPLLLERGHEIRALVRPNSRHKLPKQCFAVIGSALDGESYGEHVDGCDTFLQMVGVPHPSPAKADQFVAIDQKSGLEAIRVAKQAAIPHFIYLSVAHPAPTMQAYVETRVVCEYALAESGLKSTVLRPWYVLGPGHRWPYFLIPFYWLAERYPPRRDAARRLGLVTLPQMVAALVNAVEKPVDGSRIVEVPEIKRARLA